MNIVQWFLSVKDRNAPETRRKRVLTWPFASYNRNSSEGTPHNISELIQATETKKNKINESKGKNPGNSQEKKMCLRAMGIGAVCWQLQKDRREG